MEYREFDDPDSWAEAGAELLLESALACWNCGEIPVFCLAGGNTPEAVYRCFADKVRELGARDKNSSMGNSKNNSGTILVIPSDERWYPEEPSLRNDTMLATTLKRADPIITINSWLPTAKAGTSRELQASPHQACVTMDTTLADIQYSQDRLFACTVLGLGADGHTAGIFQETFRGAHTAVYAAEHFPYNRVSLLPKSLQRSSKTLVLVKKKGKEAAVATMLRGNALINSCMSHDTEILCLV